MASTKTPHNDGENLKTVVCFIMRTPIALESEPEVLLFREMSTTPSLLGPLIGDIIDTDASPVAAAWRLLQETTALQPSRIASIRKGKEATQINRGLGISRIVHTFLFRIKHHTVISNSSSTLEGAGWHPISAIQGMSSNKTVAQSTQLVYRAWFEHDLGRTLGTAGYELAHGLTKLRNDYESGARQLASIAVEVLRDVIEVLSIDSLSRENWLAKVRVAAWHIWRNGRESMGAAILNVLLEALRGIKNILNGSLSDTSHDGALHEMVLDYLNDFIAKRSAKFAQLISADLVKYLEVSCLEDVKASKKSNASELSQACTSSITILTLSESLTITLFLQHLVTESRFTDIELRVLESRPLFEGVSLASQMLDFARSQEIHLAGSNIQPKNVKVSVYPDAAVAMAATGVDCLLLGSDRIASSGAVSNKVGSLPAALAVKYTPRPTESRSPRVIVVSETEKIALPGDPNKHVVEHNDPKLVSRDWHSAFHSQRVKTSAQRLEEAAGSPALSAFKVEVEVQNVFFEWVPPDLIDVYATEKGILKPDQVNAFALEVVEDAKEMFGDVYGH